MTQQERIQAARLLLETITPLKGDCGTRCAAACCQPDADGKGGMLLLPGEEGLYDPLPAWASITDSGLQANGQSVYFLTCDGSCDRGKRPFSCRIFPLTPVASEDGVGVELDVRAWPMCPLMGFGVQGLSREFVAAVRAAAVILWEDETLRGYVEMLTEQLEAFRGI